MKDYYYILGVDANCTTDDIKDAYRKLSKKFHPDVNQNDRYFEERFKEIQEAYGILSDPDTRKWYNDRISNPQTYASNPEPAKPRRYPRTTAIDVIFTIILIGITILFGRYVIAAMSGSHKTIATTVTPTADTPKVAAKPVVHHKKKKHSYIADNYFKETPVPVTVSTVKKENTQAAVTKPIIKPPVALKPDTFKPQPVVIVQKPNPPIRTVSNTGDSDIPYSSYLRSNITGVVNMHRSDNFSSDIVAVIPSGSKVLVMQKGDSYYKVKFNGDEGYVPKWTVLTK